MMTEDCKAKNGGHPVVVNLEKQDLGVIALGQGQSNTNFSARAAGNAINGTAATSSIGSLTTMRNMNQEILYKCVKE